MWAPLVLIPFDAVASIKLTTLSDHSIDQHFLRREKKMIWIVERVFVNHKSSVPPLLLQAHIITIIRFFSLLVVFFLAYFRFIFVLIDSERALERCIANWDVMNFKWVCNAVFSCMMAYLVLANVDSVLVLFIVKTCATRTKDNKTPRRYEEQQPNWTPWTLTWITIDW